MRSRDTFYNYRPDSDFYYLTGFAEPEAVAVIQAPPAPEVEAPPTQAAPLPPAADVDDPSTAEPATAQVSGLPAVVQRRAEGFDELVCSGLVDTERRLDLEHVGAVAGWLEHQAELRQEMKVRVEQAIQAAGLTTDAYRRIESVLRAVRDANQREDVRIRYVYTLTCDERTLYRVEPPCAYARTCGACDWKSECPNCSAYRVFHKIDRSLRCHHCGYAERVPRACPECGNVDIAPLGRGTV